MAIASICDASYPLELGRTNRLLTVIASAACLIKADSRRKPYEFLAPRAGANSRLKIVWIAGTPVGNKMDPPS